MYNLDLAMIKGILGFLSKKLQGAISVCSTSKKEATPKVAQVGETSNLLSQDPELMVQNPLPSATIPSLEQGSIAIVEELDFEVGVNNPIELVDAIIATVVYGDPFPHNALPTLENLIHITHAVAKDGVNFQPCLKDVHKEKENLCQSDVVSKLVGISEDPSPNIVAPIFPHSEIHVSHDQMGVGPNIMEMLDNMEYARQ
jgi:hypothetical protein